ncbi:MAG TPA: ElyC/SanA/YdcF family protein, partial [Armatimonadota bacterium]
GDNSESHYDEPTRMMEYAIAEGVDPADVKMDFAGRRTYDSMYRAKHIFGLNKCVVVSQSYHLDRAIFLARHMGIDAWGYSSDRHDSPRVRMREIPACMSAVFDLYIRHPIPILGNREQI